MKLEKNFDQDTMLKQLYQRIPSGVGIYDVTGTTINMVYLNDGYYQMIGVSRDQRRQYEGTRAADVFHPDDRPGLLAEAEASVRENRMFEYRYRAFIREGCYRWLCIRASHIRLNETTERFFAAYYDIDQLMREQEKRRESELLLEETLKYSGTTHFIYFIGRRRYTAVALPEQYKRLPLTMEDYPDAFIRYVAMPEEDADRYREMLCRIDHGAAEADCDVRMSYLGQHSWFRVSCRAILDERGHADRAIGTAVPIDRFHDAQLAFREEKKHLRSMQKGLLAVSAFNVTHDRSLEENPPKPAGNLRETAAYQEALISEPALVRQSDETLQSLLSAAAEIPDAEERRLFILASSHEGMLRLYQEDTREKTLQYRRNVNGRLIWVSTRIVLMIDPVSGDVLSYFYTSDINDAMIYRRITAGIIEKNFDNVSYLDPETQILYRTENGENGQTFTPQTYQEAVEFALTNYVRSAETENVRKQYDIANVLEQLKKAPVYSIFYTARQRAETLPGRPFRRMKSDLYYLDERKNVIVILQADVTQILEQERTQRENAEAALRSAEEVRTLERVVGNIPVGLVVYRRDQSGIHVQMLNHRLAELVGETEEKIRTTDISQQVSDGVHPDDRKIAEDGLRRLFSEENAISVVYRNRRNDGDYFWLSAVGQAVEEPDGSKTAYVLYSDATEQKRREAEFDARVRDLSALNPNTLGVFHLDLTKNAVLRVESRRKDVFDTEPSETADKFIEKCIARISLTARQAQNWKNLKRKVLIDDFRSGRTETSVEFGYEAGDTGELHYATSYIYLAQNPRSGSVEALGCTLDTTEDTRSRQIMSRISEDDYDYFALLDVRKRTIHFLRIRERDRKTTPSISHDYDTDIRYAFSKLMGPEESARCIDALLLDCVLQELNRNGTYIFPFTIELPGEPLQKKQLRYEWLDESKEQILLTRMDLTKAFLREQEQVRRLAEALHEAESANAAKSDFLSRMSHDIRTPLNGIIGMTYLTQKMDLPREAGENLAKIDTSSKFLLGLINDILDMTKAENNQVEFHPEPYFLKEFTGYIDAVIRPLCNDKRQIFRFESGHEDDAVPLFDKLHINQVLFNLLSNAVKYTPEGGTITYSDHFSKAGQDGKLSVEFSVSDTGVGMSEAFQKELFKPFVREARTAGVQGTGLGLAIVKRMVDLMGGTISVRSRLNAGTTFTVRLQTDSVLPETLAETCRAEAESDAAASLKGKHILLCEDHPLNQEIARALLAEKGMITDTAEDGQRGVSMFARSPLDYYDAVLMDIRMPVMDGYGAAKAIRALDRPDAKAVPIIAMTADAFADDVQKCLDAGMNGHIAKPIDPETMCHALSEAIFSQA
jgi:PAS domain S-box-containing protein